MGFIYWLTTLWVSSISMVNTIVPLPKTWEQHFSISLHHDGGMRYETMDLLLAKDSCLYKKIENGEQYINRFKLSPVELAEVLDKMHQLKTDKLRTIPLKKSTINKGSDRICWGSAEKMSCVENGLAIGLHPADEKRFYDLVQYLTGIAELHSR